MPCNYASEDFLEMLSEIEPSKVKEREFHFPCMLKLRDGKIVERVICVEDSRGFEGDWWIHPKDVSEVLPSEERLPAALATKLYEAGESGMGYEVFNLKTKEGKEFTCVTHNVVDFPQLPKGVRTSDIAEVFPHTGRDNFGSSDFYDRPPGSTWCYYLKPKTERGGAGQRR